MKKSVSIYLVIFFQYILAGFACAAPLEELNAQVAAVENAFAKTMADRDFEAFKSFLAPDAVFWSADKPLRGNENVAAAWKGFFDGKNPPFSWKSETVMVIEGGDLAFSTGPVTSTDGNVYAYFNSVWRKNEDGNWQIVFDKGTNLRAP